MSETTEKSHWLSANFLAIFLTVAIPFAGFILGIVQLFMGVVGWSEWVLLFVFYLLTGVSVSVGLHRLFTHRTFKAKRFLKCALAILADMSWQGKLLSWCSEHRFHHMMSDKVGDFHSPYFRQDGEENEGTLKQFLHSHLLWFFRRTKFISTFRYAKDLLADKDLRFVDRHYWWWSILSLLLPGLINLAIHQTLVSFWQGVLWGGLIRIFLVQNITWGINSVTHLFGKPRYQTEDKSRNLPWFSMVSFGEGYHNNHHAFPRSAQFGFDKKQYFDFGWYFIKFFELVGWAEEVVPAPEREKTQKKLL